MTTGEKASDGRPGVCPECKRLHDEDQPCPHRLANAITMQPQALEKLTTADKAWIVAHTDFSVLEVVEEAIENLM